MREKVFNIMHETIQDGSQNTVAAKVMEAAEKSEVDENTYYSEIKEFLQLENPSNGIIIVKDAKDWAARKWGNNGPKWLATIRKRACHYCLLDGILHHGRENPKPVIIQKSEQYKILQELHVQEQTGIHHGVSKMYSALCAAYFWRGQYGDVKNFVRSCGNCVELPSSTLGSSYLPVLNSSMELINDSLSSTSNSRSIRDSLESGQLGKYKRNLENKVSNKNFGISDENGIWKKVEINLLGPYPVAVQCNKYLVVLVDPVSHWVSAQSLSMDGDFNSISASAATFAFSTFCTFGFPSVCSVIEESGLEIDIMWPKVESMMKRITFAETQSIENNSKTTTNNNNSVQSRNSPPTLLSLAGISLEQESQTLPPIELLLTSTSSCMWAWELLKKYVSENGDLWDIGLDAFLFEERRKRTASLRKSPFFHMFGRRPFHGDDNINVFHDKDLRSKRRKLRSSVFECRHCQESFTSKISFHIHQKKHTEEAQIRGLIDEETNGEDASHVSSSELPTENTSSKHLLNNSNTSSVEDMSVSSSTSRQKSIHHRPMSAASHRRKPHVKMVGGKKQYQRGITRLLTLAQVSRSLTAKGVCDEIPKDSRRASFTAQTVASVRASLEAKRKKRTCRGNYQRYSPELREEIAKYALCHGTQQAVHHFSNRLGGKPISESTVRNFIKARCSPTSHLSYFRNQGLEEEIGRFSAVAGTEAAIHCFSSRLGREIKRGTVCRLRRAYINKHPEDVTISKSTGKKKNESTRRKRRFGALLRDEIGNYAAQHGVTAAVQHFSERLLFSVRERTVAKFLKMYMEKETSKNNLLPADPESGVLGKTACMSTHVNQSIDILNSPLAVLGNLHQNNGIDRLDQGNSVSQLIYNEDAYGGLQHALHHHQPTSDNMSAVAFHTNGTTGYNDDQHSANQVILDQGIPVSFCGSQDLNFHSVQNYSNYEHAGLQVSINPMGVVQTSESVSLTIQSVQQDETVGNVRMPHALSQHSTMVVSHNSLLDSHSNSSNLQNNHQQIVLLQEEAKSEQIPSQDGQALSSNHSASLTALLPSASFEHAKNQSISSSLISPSSVSAVSLNDPAISSLQKSLARGIDPSYYSLSLATPQSFQVENSNVNDPVQDSMMNKNHENAVTLNPQPLILSEALLPVTLGSDQVVDKSNSNETQAMALNCEESICMNEVTLPEEVEGDCLGMNREVANENIVKNVTSVPVKDLNTVNALEESVSNSEASKGNSVRKKSVSCKKSKKKVTQKPKRGNYTFYSPELRARIGRYAAEHGNLQASKHFQAEVGHQIPESTIRGLRDKYVVKQMQVAATAVSGGDCADVQRQVTALGYAPRGRPMRLGKYDEIVQDCMHELVKSGEKVCSMLAITTARQVLTQYDPSLLEEFGGSIKLNNSWAKSFLKRMGLSNNS